MVQMQLFLAFSEIEETSQGLLWNILQLWQRLTRGILK